MKDYLIKLEAEFKRAITALKDFPTPEGTEMPFGYAVGLRWAMDLAKEMNSELTGVSESQVQGFIDAIKHLNESNAPIFTDEYKNSIFLESRHTTLKYIITLAEQMLKPAPIKTKPCEWCDNGPTGKKLIEIAYKYCPNCSRALKAEKGKE